MKEFRLVSELYLITGPKGLQYVGVTSATASKRWLQHVSDAFRNDRTHNRLYNAIRKHGAAAFFIRTLLVASWEYVLNMEQSAIEAFKTMSPNGYNLKTGGFGGRHSPEVCARIAAAHCERAKDPTELARLSAISRANWASPEGRAKNRRVEIFIDFRSYNNY